MSHDHVLILIFLTQNFSEGLCKGFYAFNFAVVFDELLSCFFHILVEVGEDLKVDLSDERGDMCQVLAWLSLFYVDQLYELVEIENKAINFDESFGIDALGDGFAV